jgi:flagellar basal-body rod modification protein FlgD
MQVTPRTASAASPTAASTATNASNSNSALTETQFLQLLTEQLENQDPLQPEDDTQFLAQMAQFTSLQEADTTNQQISNLTAATYIGTTVTINPGSGNLITGQVQAVDTSGASPQLVVNGSEYPLSALQLVQPTGVAAPPTSATPSQAPTSSTPTSIKVKL